MSGKLRKEDIEDILSLTSTQEGMLFHYITNPNSKEYHEQLSLTICGEIEIDLIKKAWEFVVESNEMLRTIFRWEETDKPIQIILKNYSIPFKEYDLSKEERKVELLNNIRENDMNERIDIANEPLRVTLCKLCEDKLEMIISNHHILYDGWCNGIILKEFMGAYNNFYNGIENKKVVKNKFKEFIKWSNSQDKSYQKEYWQEYLQGIESNNNHFYSDNNKEKSMKKITKVISEELGNKIKEFSKNEKVSSAAILYSIWGMLLQKYSNSDEAIFGTTVSGRTSKIKGADEIVGLFINTIPLRVQKEEYAINIIKKVEENLRAREEYENTPLVDIKSYSSIIGTEELFDSIVVIENYPLDSLKNDKDILKIDSYSIFEQTNFNMVLAVMNFDNIELNFQYNENVVTRESIEKMAQHYENILANIAEKKNVKVSELEMLGEEEKDTLLYEFNSSYMDYEKDKTIHELFEEQVKKNPDKIALFFEDKRVSYKELNEKANSLARTLRDKGVKADSIVGIMVERSINMMVGILAVLKAGGAYLPIDPNYPAERIKYIIDDSKTEILLTEDKYAEKVIFHGEVIDLKDKSIYSKEKKDLEKINTSKDLAYIIYTSGSTGKPKGTMIEHKSVINTLTYMENKYPLMEGESYLLKTGYTFDVSVTELFGWFFGKGSLVILKPEGEKDVDSIISAIDKFKVTHINFVPSMLKLFIDELKGRENSISTLKYVFSAGEAISKELIRRFYSSCKRIKLENIYGPTETTIYVTAYSIADYMENINVPIGRPLGNTEAYIINKDNELQPIGVAGELCISGDGLARGYLNNSKLTGEKFVPNPFASGKKMYKTGDLAKWLPDGNIEFLGRIDHQVKIRGFRIELGEIESQLIKYEGVKEAVVIDKEDSNGVKYLCAYVVGEKEFTVSELRNHLSNTLTDYMVPSYYIQIDKIPLNFNGKVDRKALPEPNGNIAVGTKYEAPRTELEDKLASIWSKVLGVEGIGINDNFFELGGHSLKATNLSSKIHKQLNVEIPLMQIFETPTIKGISEYINKSKKSIYSSIEPVEEREYYEASSAQKRMYMLQQFDLESTGYNMPAVMLVEGKLDLNKMENSFLELIKRHHILRTQFESIDERIVQRVNHKYDFNIEHIENSNKAIEEIVQEFIRPFDLNKGPLIRVGILKEEDDKYIVIFDMHHIISDGVSVGILMKELKQIYEGKVLEALKIQYKDFSEWQNKLLKSEEMQRQEAYWVERFSGDLPVLDLPTDYVRPTMQSFEGDYVNFKLDTKLTKELKGIAKETGSTMYMVFLASINVLLSRYSGQEDIVVGSPIAGRPHADLENIIGMFVNTIAMRNFPEGKKTYGEFLKEVKENSLKAYENQDYQFEELVDKLNIHRDISRNPIFDVMFSMENMEKHDIQLNGASIKEYNIENKISKFDLSFIVNEENDEIELSIQYCTRLFKKQTIIRMMEHYVNILKAIFADTNIKVNEIDMISEAEKSKLIYEFNDTSADYPRDKTIQELFEIQAELFPNNVAVAFEEKKLTYRELNEKANSLARTLREKGVKADSIVAMVVEPSLEMIVGIMAILKAGGTYLPISPEYPEDRIEYTLKDSNTNILLIQKGFMEKVDFQGERICLQDESIFDKETCNLEKVNSPRDMAYIIYTSGTTGRPKGVMIEHENVVRLMFNSKMQFDFNEKDVWTMFHSYCFDFSVWEMYGALLYGGKLVLVPKNTARDTEEYLKLLKKEKVTILNQIPTPFYNLMNIELKQPVRELNLRYIIFGGEALKPEMLSEWAAKYPETKIINMYGITETTVHVTYKEIGEKEINERISNIGKPIPTLTTYIMDKNLKLQPIGVPGELCVGGAGVARGYLNKKELTEEKFVMNPYKPEEKIYRSGDLARMLPSGEMEYLGRIDHQVKIRGFRIELGEIESQLLAYEAVKEVIVLDKDDNKGDKFLCAYIVAEKVLTVGELRKHLSINLPDYMIPAYFIQLEKMPLTTNGKVDRKALPKPDGNMVIESEYEAPRNEAEKILVEIWRGVLEVDRVGINDNFFELGGHSLKAAAVISRINKELEVEIPLREMFQTPTIKGISDYVENTKKTIYSNIEVSEEKEYYEASSAQKRMYMLQQIDLGSTGYNMPGAMIVEGKLDLKRLQTTLNNLIQRQEALRTYFNNFHGNIVQRIVDNIQLDIEYIDISEALGEIAASNITELAYREKDEIDELINDFIRPFELEKAPLLRVGVAKLEDEKHILMFDMHHIISDGVSMGILINEFTELYQGVNMESLKIQYKDFSEWQKDFLKTEPVKNQEQYWTSRFSDDIPVLNMPTDFTRPAIQSFEGDSIDFKLGKEITKDLKRLAEKTGSTMYMILLSATTILLSKYSGQEDIVLGSPIAGRPHADLEKIIGMFVNTLPMRNFPKSEMGYREFLLEAKENALKAYENQDYQFEELVDKLSISRDISRNPLFDVMFTMQNMNIKDIEIKGLNFKEYKKRSKISKFDLTFSAREAEGEVLFSVDYGTKLFKKETVEKMAEHYINILKSISINDNIPLCEIDMLTKEEKIKILYEFNDTSADYPKNKTIHQLFEEQVEKTPYNIAVISGEEKLTYRELNIKANKLARTLREKGVKADSVVGLMVERSLEMIVSIMAILKAGGAYLPIDPNYPEDRISYVLEDSKTNIVLTEKKFMKEISFKGEVLDLHEEDIYNTDGENLDNINDPKDLAYIIYTSGSTGRPKGTMIENYSVINRLNWMQKRYPLSGEDTILQKTTYTFDVSVWELIWWSFVGAKVCMLEPGEEKEPKAITDAVEKNKVTVMHFVPSMLNIFLEYMDSNEKLEKLKTLKYVFASGEALGIQQAKSFKEGINTICGAELINLYGPTEATVDVTYFDCFKEAYGRSIPIGRPIDNIKMYVTNKAGMIQPIGVPGEICISGDGLARGYLNKEELTSEKFVINSYLNRIRMYKTGDLGRWLPDGNIEYLGRIDHQVKIRGFRIELGEIENQLLEYNAIKEAVVIAREDKNGTKYLCAYIVADKEVTVSELREHLSKKLTDYMIPSYFVQLEKMPLTGNGKIDRKLLPEPEGNINTGTEYEGPRNEIEESLVEIWKEVLAVDKIGINDNFFELGGHSLKAATVISKINKELGIDLPLREMFSFPTIKAISKFIRNTNESMYVAIDRIEEKEYYKVSSAQKRIYMLQQFDLKSTAYNMPTMMLVDGELDVFKLEKAFKELIKRHETLRTSFETIGDDIVQKINEEVEFKLEYIKKSMDKLADEVVKEFIRTFELAKAPLLRAGILEIDAKKYLLMVDMHHIISDGVSTGILINEFMEVYNGHKLEELTIQYKDYSEWQNNMLNSEEIKKQESYWVNRFSDEIPVLNMPTDFPRPSVQSYEGKNFNFIIDKNITQNLRKVAKGTDSTMYMVLLSALNILLSKYSSQEDIVIGSAAAGRNHADLDRIIGMFVNTLPMRNYPKGEKTYKEFLAEVKENSLNAYENQDYQFEELVDKLNFIRDASRNPLFDVMFAMQNMDSRDLALEDLKLKEYNHDNNIAKFDLTFTATEKDEEIIINLNYCTNLFKEETIKRIADHLINILRVVSCDQTIEISEIDMVAEEEKNKLLYDFNNTRAEYPRDKTIYQLFEEQAEKTPDSIAAVSNGKKITYRELNERANALARTLREKGVKDDSIVGIMVERSIEVIVGILGVLKAGGAYLPIDPEYPADRVNYMLRDSGTKVVIAEESLKEIISRDLDILDINEECIYNKNTSNLNITCNSDNLAYIIYTSGTTGRPKGVAVIQKSVVRLVKNTNYIEFQPEDRILQTGSITFDASTFEIWGSLLNGIPLHIESKDIILDVKNLEEYLIENKITILWLTSPLFNKICEENERIFSSVRCLLVGGDVVSPKNVSLVRKHSPNLTVVNGYGPTENTTFSTCYVIKEALDENRALPIGKPIANSTAYILDKNKKIVPIGVYGELCVAGDGLARGYLNSEDLTAEKFVDNPYEYGQRMYKTGDLARWLPDGNIEFLGRIDHQVKIRGFRIELGEIEKCLLKLEDVKEAIVIDREEKGNKYLCAYLVTETQYNVGELREELKKSLPDYMIPSYFILLEKMPLNLNGKIDRKALPKPDGDIDTGMRYEAPRNELEEKLAKLWQEILGVNNIGINDNFFDLGGHSLKATALSNKMHKELGIEIPLKELFKAPTIKGISSYAGNIESNIYTEIRKVEEKEFYDTSSAQRRMYMLQQFDLESTAYNMPGVIIADGALDVASLEKAFKELIERHESLRTYFVRRDESIEQRIDKDIDFKIIHVENFNNSIDEALKKFVKPFDLSNAPLIRVGLMELAKEKFALMIDMHHIIFDGVSMAILIKELTMLYEGEKLEGLKLQYKDYSQWQNELLKSQEMKKQEEYWKSIFSDEIPVLNIPTDYVRPAIQSFEGDSIELELNEELTKGLKEVAKETNSTMFMVVLSAINVLLSKYSAQEDIVIGSPIAGRSHGDLEKIIGMFVNTLAMRNYPKGDKTFEEFLREVRANSLAAYEKQDYQFEELVEKLNIGRNISRNPLFDVMFMMQNMDYAELKAKDISFKLLKTENKVSKFDLTFSAKEEQKSIALTIEYSTRLFNRDTIEKMAVHFKNILWQIIRDQSLKISEIDMTTEEEKNRLLFEINDTFLDYEREKSIHELFEEQAEKTPNNVAVIFKDKKYTYKELNTRANSLARVLREQGVHADSLVGLMVERSAEMLVGIMAILKAGGGYLPIDPSFPKDRIEYMLEDSKIQLLLTERRLFDKVNFDGNKIDIQDDNLYLQPSDNLEVINTSKDLAYVIYTSGSTGKPKGVMIEHKQVCNFIAGITERLALTDYHTILCITTISFDIFVLETLAPLAKGLTVVMTNEEEQLEGSKLNEIIAKNKVDLLQITPSRLQLLMEGRNFDDSIRLLRMIMVGGEPLPVQLYEKLSSYPEVKICNMYGPTETTVWSTVKEMVNGEAITIGKPIANTRIYVVNSSMKLQPLGVVGEICIAGEGLARGYLNNEELTKERFVSNPFEEGTRMYRTGDLGRVLQHGNIECHGRIDHQVKVRGYRIELGEIESQILSYRDIQEAVVIDREDKNKTKYLCAYVTSEKELMASELKLYLSEKMPDYMIPSYFMQIDNIPLTENGKINRKALPEPEGNLIASAIYEAPRNELEEKLAAIWKEILGLERVGINDNFFELGGHSLKATVLVGKIYKEIGIELALRDIFNAPTIKGICSYIQRTGNKTYSSIEPVEEKEYYRTSSAQKRMYMMQQFDLQGTVYNMPATMLIEGKVDRYKFERVFKELIQRHEILRTSFKTIDEEIVQIIHKEISFKVEYEEIANKDTAQIINEFIRTFDLTEAPLIRVGLIKIGEDKHLFIFDMHHIISDGVSISIIIKEFLDMYEDKELEEIRINYKDYSEWQNKILNSEEVKNQEKYWIERFSKEIPKLNLPTDYARPVIQSFEGDNIKFRLNKDTTEQLKKIAKDTGATMYMVLLSGINILLSKYSGQEDIIIGSAIAGRVHPDIQNTIGMFINTLAMRNEPKGNKSYVNFLKEVKENSLKAYENQYYQFEELVDKLNLARDISRNPLFDVMFTMQNMDNRDIELKDLSFKSIKADNKISRFDLTFTASHIEEEIEFNVEYSTKLFKTKTIEKMIIHFKNILKAAIEKPEICLSELEMLTEEEKNKLLYEFNNTETYYAKDKTLQELFEEQVCRTPNNIAVVFENEELTYKELNEKANRLARTLREKGVKADSIVGIMVDRSLEMVIGILGILKAGGAYLPMISEYPEERIKYMLEDSNARILLTERSYVNKVEFDGEIIDLQDERTYCTKAGNLECINKPKDLAYVIYTSGSTGRPKGVMIEHRSVANLVTALYKNVYMKYDGYLKVTLLAPYVFDASVQQIFASLLMGHALFIVPEHVRKDGEKLLQYYSNKCIDLSDGTPMHIEMLLNALESECNKKVKVKHFIIGGDVLAKKSVERFIEEFGNKQCKITNIYGPTECCVDSTAYLISKEKIGSLSTIPIGSPLSNLKVYILNEDKKLVPLGVNGEVYISGDGLARGYLNNPQMTEERFISNPFSIGEKMYKTGDLARWNEDGDIEFVSRIDNQVKIRGFRIELGEIENQLLSYEAIKEAVVLDREDDNGIKYLCAYVVSEKEVTISELREHLAKKLPEYMIPSYFIQLGTMPLTSNGKIDRKNLLKIQGSMNTGTEYKAPSNEIEEQLVEIWEEMLGADKIGVKDNFFDLGGHSLKATKLSGKIFNTFKVNIPLSEIFKSPYIEDIAKYIAEADNDLYVDNNNEIILLKRGKKSAKNFFFIHSLSGEPEVYTKLTDFLKDEFNYWGIRIDKIENDGPQNISIEEMANSYINKLKKVQPKGPYYLSGWCVGGIIAYEMVRQLEAVKEQVEFLGLYNSPTLNTGIIKRCLLRRDKGFDTASEIKILKKILLNYNIKDKHKGSRNIHELWSTIIEDISQDEKYNDIKQIVYENICKSAPVMEKVIKDGKKMDIKDIMYYFNLLRTFIHAADKVYLPEGKINAKINYFVASKEQRKGKESWCKQSKESAEFHYIEADHFSMFEKEEDIEKLGTVLDKLLN